MGKEIERKFLVKTAYWQTAASNGILYRQGYLLRSEHKTIRVRVVEGKGGYLTIKGKTSGFTRPEYEYPIPGEDATALLENFCEAMVVKKRFEVMVAGKLWEVDVFLGDNEGLIVAELELEDEQESFDLPEWIGEEVTGDDRYYNSQLSVHPYKNWTP